MKNIEIFEMTLEDYVQIKDVLISDFDNFWSPEILKSEIIGENKKYIVAKQNNEIIGFAGILLNFPDIEIMNIVTKKSERNQGIGTALLDKIIEIAKNNNFEKIFLEVNEKNLIAKKLYENAGFVREGLRKNYYNSKDDAIIMCCYL